LAPVAVAAGELCPNAGELRVTQGPRIATVKYLADGSVMVTQGATEKTFPDCVTVDLMQCS
jgi:hypothetical protein